MRSVFRLWPGLLALILLIGIGVTDRWSFANRDRIPTLSAVTLRGDEGTTVIQCGGEVLVVWPGRKADRDPLERILKSRRIDRIHTLVVLQGDGTGLAEELEAERILTPEATEDRPLTLGAAGGTLTLTEQGCSLTLYHGDTSLLYCWGEISPPFKGFDFIQCQAADPLPIADSFPTHTVICGSATAEQIRELKARGTDCMCTEEGAVQLYLEEDALRLTPDGSRFP